MLHRYSAVCIAVLSCFAPAAAAVRTKNSFPGPKGGAVRLVDGDSSPSLRRSLKSKNGSKKHGPQKRDCKLKESTSRKQKMEFKCDSKDDEIHDRIRYKIETSSKGSSALKIKVQYKRKLTNDDSSEDEETEEESNYEEEEEETNYEISFDRLIEYRANKEGEEEEENEEQVTQVARQSGTVQATNNTTIQATQDESKATTTSDDEAYTWEADNIIQEMALQDWDDFSEVDDDGSFIRFSVSSSNGLASFFFTIARETSDENATTTSLATANQMKIDFELSDFPWIANNSNVALLSSVQSKERLSSSRASKKTVEISFSSAKDGTSLSPFGEYTWEEEADAVPAAVTARSTNNNTTATEESSSSKIRVIATSPASTTEDDEEDSFGQQIAFSFVGKSARSARDIYWDPSAGVGYDSGAAAIRWGRPVCSFAFLVAAMGLLLF